MKCLRLFEKRRRRMRGWRSDGATKDSRTLGSCVRLKLLISWRSVLMNDLTFVLIQWTVLCVQLIGIPILLLALIAEECLFLPTPQQKPAG
jgi:hypothetical protein